MKSFGEELGAGEGGPKKKKAKQNHHLRGSGFTMPRLRSFQSWQSAISPNLLAPQGCSRRWTRDLGVAWAAGLWALGFAAKPVQGKPLKAQGPRMGPQGLIEAESDSLKVIFLHLRFIS